MFGCTKPTSEVTAVAETPPCKYHLGLGIYNVQTAVEEDGWQQTITHVAFVRQVEQLGGPSINQCCRLIGRPFESHL